MYINIFLITTATKIITIINVIVASFTVTILHHHHHYAVTVH